MIAILLLSTCSLCIISTGVNHETVWACQKCRTDTVLKLNEWSTQVSFSHARRKTEYGSSEIAIYSQGVDY